MIRKVVKMIYPYLHQIDEQKQENVGLSAQLRQVRL